MLKLLLITFLLSPETPKILISEDVLAEHDLHKTRYGIVYDDHMYITYLHVIAKFDMGGNLIADYTKKGQGPGERMGGPMFRFGDEIWCWGSATNKFLILDMNLDFKREVPTKFSSAPLGNFDTAPGENSIYVLTMKGTEGDKPFLQIESRSPKDLALEAEIILKDIPVDKKSLMRGFRLGLNYLGDNTFAVYREAQVQEEYVIYLWNAKDWSIQKLSHMTPQLPPENTMKQLLPNLFVNGASRLLQVNRTSNGYKVFFGAFEIAPNKDSRDRDRYLFTHQFGNDKKPSKVTQDTAFVLVSRGLTDATLIRHPDLGIEVLDL